MNLKKYEPTISIIYSIHIVIDIVHSINYYQFYRDEMFSIPFVMGCISFDHKKYLTTETKKKKKVLKSVFFNLNKLKGSNAQRVMYVS